MGDFYFQGLGELLAAAEAGREEGQLIDESEARLRREGILRRGELFAAQSEAVKKKILKIPSNLFFIENSPEKIIQISRLASGEKGGEKGGEKDGGEGQGGEWLAYHNRALGGRISIQPGLVEFIGPAVELERILDFLRRFDLKSLSFYELFGGLGYARLEYARMISQTARLRLGEFLASSRSRPKIELKLAPGEARLDMDYARDYAKLAVNARDERGMMAFLMGCFRGLVLLSARVRTVRGRTRNIFIFEKSPALAELEARLVGE